MKRWNEDEYLDALDKRIAELVESFKQDVEIAGETMIEVVNDLSASPSVLQALFSSPSVFGVLVKGLVLQKLSAKARLEAPKQLEEDEQKLDEEMKEWYRGIL